MSANLRANTLKSYLTLSVASEVLLQSDRSVAARFEDLLELRHRAAIRGYTHLAEAYTERLLDEVWRCPDGLNGPGGHAT